MHQEKQNQSKELQTTTTFDARNITEWKEPQHGGKEEK